MAEASLTQPVSVGVQVLVSGVVALAAELLRLTYVHFRSSEETPTVSWHRGD